MPAVLPFTPRQVSPGLISCEYCHGEIDVDARFCKHCGNKVKKEKASRKQKYAPKTKHTKVPLKTPDEIATMQKKLATPTKDNEDKRRLAMRNFTLFSLGISIGLRSSDLTTLKVSHFLDESLAPKRQLHVVEIKTGKEQNIDIDAKVSAMIKTYVSDLGLTYDDYLAWSQHERRVGKYTGEMLLTPYSWNRIVTTAAEQLGWDKTLYGGHTIRKTFGYNFYTNANKTSREHGTRALAMLCRRFNHSSEAVTLCYIGIEHDEIMRVCKLTTDQYNLAYEEALKYELGDKDEDM